MLFVSPLLLYAVVSICHHQAPGVIPRRAINHASCCTSPSSTDHYLTVLPSGCERFLQVTANLQANRALINVRNMADDLDRHSYLTALQERNESLFYKLLLDNIKELLPIVHMPTVSEYCAKYALMFRSLPRALFISLNDRGEGREQACKLCVALSEVCCVALVSRIRFWCHGYVFCVYHVCMCLILAACANRQ